MTTNDKPPKRRYRLKGCARCNGYGVLIVYEQPMAQHTDFAKSVGAANMFTSEQTTANLRSNANSLLHRGVPMACPDCRNLQEAAAL